MADFIKKKDDFWHKGIATLVAISVGVLTVYPPAYAETITPMPPPGTVVHASQAVEPLLLEGLKVYSENPFRLDFIVDPGERNLSADDLRSESTRSIKYFLTALTIPRNDLWVNLSPYEKDRIIPEEFGQTDMGRDLLAQDYFLKQLTASLIHPDEDLGKRFWKKIYEEAFRLYGTTDIPVDTFNKVWVVPGGAGVYEEGDKVLVVESHLKVMLDADYVALEAQKGVESRPNGDTPPRSDLDVKIMREIVIPAIEREVNEGENFAALRQIYHSLILAQWYKKRVQDIMFREKYIDQRKIGGIEINDKQAKEEIYRQYVEAFKKGVYNLIREESDPYSEDVIPRKYFSGGFGFNEDLAMVSYPSSAVKVSNFLRESVKKAARVLLLGVILNVIPVGGAVQAAAPDGQSGGTENLTMLGMAGEGDISRGNRLLAMNSIEEMGKAMEHYADVREISKEDLRDIIGFMKEASRIPGVKVETIQKAKDIMIKGREIIKKDKGLLKGTLAALFSLQSFGDSGVRGDARYIIDKLRGVDSNLVATVEMEYQREGAKSLGESISRGIVMPKTDLLRFLEQINEPGKLTEDLKRVPGLAEILIDKNNALLIREILTQTGGESVSMYDLVQKLGVTQWESIGPASVIARNGKGEKVWECRATVAPGKTGIWAFISDEPVMSGIGLLVALGLVKATIDLMWRRSVGLTELEDGELAGDTILPTVDAEKVAASVNDDPRNWDRQKVLEAVKGLDPKVVARLSNQKKIKLIDTKELMSTKELIERVRQQIQAGAAVSDQEADLAKQYLRRRHAALKGWVTRRIRAGQIKPEAVSQPQAFTLRTVEQAQFLQQWNQIREAVGSGIEDLTDGQSAVNRNRLAVLNQLEWNVKDFYIRHSKLIPRIRGEESPGKYLVRLFENLLMPRYVIDEQSVQGGEASWLYNENSKAPWTAKISNGVLHLQSHPSAPFQEITFNLTERTKKLVKDYIRYQSAEAREQYFLYDSMTPQEQAALPIKILAEIVAQELAPADNASSAVGGIDLNADLLDLKVSSNGPEISFSPQAMTSLNGPLAGFIPQIISAKRIDLQTFFELPVAASAR